MKKRYILFLALPILALGAVWAAEAYAGTAFNPREGLVSAIAQKFNLNAGDVQQVFNQHKEQMKTGREERFKENLSARVSNGNLTQEQADKIIAKRAELESQMEARRNSGTRPTAEEAKTQMNSLKQWAEENNIPLQYLMPGGKEFGLKGGFGPGNGECPMAGN